MLRNRLAEADAWVDDAMPAGHTRAAGQLQCGGQFTANVGNDVIGRRAAARVLIHFAAMQRRAVVHQHQRDAAAGCQGGHTA